MNSERIILSRDKDKMFLPMNVEGGSYEEKFFNTTKILTIAVIVITWVFFIVWLNSLQYTSIIAKFISILILFVITVYAVRFIIFEESYFYRMYKKTLLYSNPTSDVFWNIASIKDNDIGSVILFSDGRIGVLIKLKRGSIIGRGRDFIEEHYDAVSNFLREIVLRGYKYVNLNMMERADNDNRLDDIGIKLNYVENPNIKKLLELELGYLKNVTRNSLYESDYYLLYTERTDKIDSIFRDADDILEILLNGCFIGYEVLNKKEIIALHKELIGVSYFDYSAASVNTYRDYQIVSKPALAIKKLYLTNGSVVELSKEDESILRTVVTDIENSDDLVINVLDRFNAIKGRSYNLKSGLDLDLNNKAVKETNKLSSNEDNNLISKFKYKRKNKKLDTDLESKSETDNGFDVNINKEENLSYNLLNNNSTLYGDESSTIKSSNELENLDSSDVDNDRVDVNPVINQSLYDKLEKLYNKNNNSDNHSTEDDSFNKKIIEPLEFVVDMEDDLK